MKKISIVILIALTAFMALSCKSTPAAPKIEGEVTQEKVNAALDQIYDTYRTKLDFTGAQEYTVVSGDTLSAITRKFYGSLTSVGDAGPHNGFYFPVLYLASDNEIVDPDIIEIGMKLKVVDLQKNLSNPVSRQAIKDCLNDVSYVYSKKGRPADEEGLKKLSDSL